jgi:DNA invertase Pin-like site-specific DNA recombinase
MDRLGRNYADVMETIRELMRLEVIVRTVIDGLPSAGTPRTR